MAYTTGYSPLKETGILNKAPRRVALFNSAAALCLTILSMTWWIADTGFMDQHAIPRLVVTKFNTAAALLLCAMAALLRLYTISASGTAAREEIGAEREDQIEVKLAAKGASVLSALAGLLGLATLVEYLLNMNLGVDELLIRDYYASELHPLLYPGRPMPMAALCVFLLALALFGWEWKPVVWLRQVMVLVPLSISIVVIFGLFYGSAPSVKGQSIVAPLAAIVLLLLSFAVLCMTPRGGYMEMFWSDSHAGRVLRLMAPCALLLPGLLGFMLRLRGYIKYDLVTGMMVITLVNTCLFEVLLWVVLRKLRIMEKRRWHAQTVLLEAKQKQAQLLERTVAARTNELAESLMQMRAILESSNDGILSVDVECKVNFLNPAAERLLGIGASDARGHAAAEVLQINGRDGVPIDPQSGLLGEALRTGTAIRADEQTFWRSNDTSFPAECIATPIYVAQKMQGAVLTFRDVSERSEIDRMKSEFVSIVSHELRTPLTSVRGVLGLLAGGKLADLSPRSQHMVELAERNAEKLSQLINSIVDVERLESGRMRLHQVFTTSSELVRRTNEVVTPVSEAAGVTLQYNVKNITLQLDVDRVSQVMVNLISNAVKYSQRGRTVTITISLENELAHFSIADQGPGIEKEMQSQVFERFQQGDSSDVRGKGGTGLGLTIARGIVQRHGGHIWVESEVGCGSVFHFTLPQRRRRKADDALPLGLS